MAAWPRGRSLDVERDGTMKKLLTVAAALAILAGAAHAQTSSRFIQSPEGKVADHLQGARMLGVDRMRTGSINGPRQQRRMMRPNFVMSPEARIN